MTELEASGVGEHPPPYIIFVVVFLFFLTGLFGFLVCHLLKKKGYRCRTIDDEDEMEDKLGGNADDEDEENQDTVEQILKCIIENEANMEAFNEMFGNKNVCVRHDPRLRKESIGGVPPHHHTVHSGTDHNSCHLCAQVRSKKGRQHSRNPRSKQRPGEQTVFSVGRFRVTHMDKKLHGGPNTFASSGDQLDQSQDSEERKEGVYNLRSMFKDVQSPPQSSNGIAPNLGKHRKSISIFGLRRGSDPVGIKIGGGASRETGGVRFAIQQQPVVVEEPLQAGKVGVQPERGTKPGINPETQKSKNPSPASLQREAKTSGSVNSPSSRSNDQAHDSSSAPEDGSKHGPSPDSCTNLMIKPSVGSTAASPPSSLSIGSPASSGQTFKTTEKRGDLKDMVSKNAEAYDPGPLQTSTPIAPLLESIQGVTPVVPTSQSELFSNTGFLVTQTPPDPSSSKDLEPGFGASLALISLGSSPPSSFPIKTPSPASSLKTPTSPMAVTPSPKIRSRNMSSEAANISFSPALTPSPKLPSGPVLSVQSPILSSSFGKSTSPLLARSPSPALMTSPKLDARPVSPQPPSASPVEGDSKGFSLSSPSDQLSKERLSNLAPSPSTPLTPSSPSITSSVTIVKASPDSKREFSVVTMLEEKEISMSVKDQSGETPGLLVESETPRISPAVGQEGDVSVSSVGQPESQSAETSGTDVRSTVNQMKDDMVEMEDIKDCKVMQVEDVGRLEEAVKIGNI